MSKTIKLKRSFAKMQLPASIAHKKVLFAKRAFANELHNLNTKEFYFGFQEFPLDAVREQVSAQFPGLILPENFFENLTSFAGIIYVDSDAESGYLSIRVKKLYQLPTEANQFGDIEAESYLFNEKGELVKTDESVAKVGDEGIEFVSHSISNLEEVPDVFNPVFSTENPLMSVPNVEATPFLEPIPELAAYSKKFNVKSKKLAKLLEESGLVANKVEQATVIGHYKQIDSITRATILTSGKVRELLTAALQGESINHNFDFSSETEAAIRPVLDIVGRVSVEGTTYFTVATIFIVICDALGLKTLREVRSFLADFTKQF